jgi:hypothetical protein
MEILLIDLGALALFLGFMALVYWHGVAQPSARRQLAHRATPSGAPDRSDPPGGLVRVMADCRAPSMAPGVSGCRETPAAPG